MLILASFALCLNTLAAVYCARVFSSTKASHLLVLVGMNAAFIVLDIMNIFEALSE